MYDSSFPFKTQEIVQGKLSDTIKCDFVVSCLRIPKRLWFNNTNLVRLIHFEFYTETARRPCWQILLILKVAQKTICLLSANPWL